MEAHHNHDHRHGGDQPHQHFITIGNMPGTIEMTKCLVKKLMSMPLEELPAGNHQCEDPFPMDYDHLPVQNMWKDAEILDFACGPFGVSRHMAGIAKTIVGIDISPELVEEYNQRAASMGVGERCRAFKMDFLEPDQAENDLVFGDRMFDIAVCVNAYHHIGDLVTLTKNIARRMKPGAWLVVVEVLRIGDKQFSAKPGTFGIAHQHGVNGDQLIKTFDEAGLKSAGCISGVRTVSQLPRDLLTKGDANSPVENVEMEFVIAYGKINNF